MSNRTRRHRLILALQRWPARECWHSIGGFMWHFKNDRAISGNVIVTRVEWQKAHFKDRNHDLELA
ncbi:hypothetical protein [Carnimonas bestiolae]|uniref:hypothetical protein n=1 Tax=Carnimonas bestiolae TaxID=3402172 RepID=UPI003EDBA1D2